MKFKLHNKFEITINNNTIVAYNTLTNLVYNKIAALESYNGYIALGNGEGVVSKENTKLTSFVKSYKAETEEISANPLNENLFVRKVVTLDESDQSSFSFCELGLCCDSSENPDIYNRVLLTNDDGQVITVQRNPGDVMQIKVTIYLQLNSESRKLLTPGNNPLLCQILGEDLGEIDREIYVTRGECLSKSTNLKRCLPDLNNQVPCICSVVSDDDEITLTFSAKLGTGKTEEIMLIFNNHVCMRLSTLEISPAVSLDMAIIGETGEIVELGSDVKNITSITTSNDSAYDDYYLTFYGNKFTDKNYDVFDQVFTHETRRFVSVDGEKIAFIQDNNIYLYACKDFGFKKLYSDALPSSNIINLSMNQNTLVFVLSVSPYVRIFEIDEDENISEIKTSLLNFNMAGYTHDFLKANCAFAGEKILLGVILNEDAKTPLVMRLSKNQSGTYIDELVSLNLDYASEIVAFQKSPYNDASLLFLTDHYNGQVTYGLQMVTANELKWIGSTVEAYALLHNTSKIQVGGRVIIADKNDNGGLETFYLPNLVSAGDTSLTNGTKHYLSYNGDYLIAKYNDGSYKFFNSHNKGELIEIPSSNLMPINLNTAIDFVFVKDLLLVFTNDNEHPLYSVMIKKDLARLDNVNQNLSSVSYTKYDLLGADESEGVMFNFTLKFNK